MSAAKFRTADFDVRLSCSLCMEPYRDRTPKILPCFHTFCLLCLKSIVKSAASKQTDVTADDDVVANTTGGDGKEDRESDEKAKDETRLSMCKVEEADDELEDVDEKRATFRCPTCRVHVLVPAGGVSQFQTNFYLNIEDPSDSTPPALCDTCEEGSRDKATQECGECRKKMCSRCSRLHGMFAQLQGHRVRPLDARAVEISTSRVMKPRECPSHPSQPICFHCRQCDVSICLHCKLTSHEGHATEDIMAAVTRAKGELSKLILTANDQIHVLEAMLGALERDSQEISRQKQEMTSIMMTRYEALVSWATRARDEALEEMECVERAALKEIEAERVVAQDTKQMLSRLVARATYSCQTDADPDIVLNKSELQAALLNDDTLARYRTLGSKEGHATFFTCRSDSKAVQLDHVRDFVGRQEGQEQIEKDKIGAMSVRELSERVVEMAKSLDDLRKSLTTIAETIPEFKHTSVLPIGTKPGKKEEPLTDDEEEEEEEESLTDDEEKEEEEEPFKCVGSESSSLVEHFECSGSNRTSLVEHSECEGSNHTSLVEHFECAGSNSTSLVETLKCPGPGRPNLKEPLKCRGPGRPKLLRK